MRTFLAAVAVTGLSLLSCAAHADTFNFSATALGATVTGTLVATNNNDGSYLVTSISGSNTSGASITGLIGRGDPFFGNDNLIIPGNARVLDVNGLAFMENIGGQLYSLDIYTDQTGFQFESLDSNFNFLPGTANFSLTSPVAVTPEPSSLVLLGTGLLGAVTAMRRRFI